MLQAKQLLFPATLYPTQGEIIRSVANAFDIKANHKKLDDYVRNGDTDYNLCEQMIDDVICSQLKKISPNLSDDFKYFLKTLIDQYLLDILEQPHGDLSRTEYFPELIKNYFLPFVYKVLGNFLQEKSLLFDKMLNPVDSDTSRSFKYIEENFDGWEPFYNSLNKENKDKLRGWKKGNILPSFVGINSINNLGIDSHIDSNAWIDIKTLLLFSRGLTWVKKTDPFIGFQNTAITDAKLKPSAIHHVDKFYDNYQIIYKNMMKENKYPNAKNNLRKSIDAYKKDLDHDDPQNLLLYTYYHFEALWNLYSGDNSSALKYYKKAFKRSLFRAGKHQKNIILEAIHIAAREQDRAFLKRLKNQAIVFNMYHEPFDADPLDFRVNNKKSRSKSNLVEDWEVDSWSNKFHFYFKKERFFNPEKIIADRIFSKLNDIKADYRLPDRNFKIAIIGRTKKQPQLQIFTTLNKPDIVKELLDRGASVNALSDAGDTALLIALENMAVLKEENLTGLHQNNLDHRCFDIISAYPHEPKTMNQRTTKQKLLPLMSAVCSGQPDIVKKVLHMGAEVDRRSTLDNLTVLYFCLRTISLLNDPFKLINNWLKLSVSQTTAPILQDAIRRSNNGIELNLGDKEHKRIRKFFTLFSKISHKKDFKENHLDNVYKIIDLLLESGANPNEKHKLYDAPTQTNLQDYTPLMFAAEIGDVKSFEKLRNWGGNPEQTYWDPIRKRDLNSWHVARGWKKDNILELQKS